MALRHSRNRILKCWNSGSSISRIFMVWEACRLFPASCQYQHYLNSYILATGALEAPRNQDAERSGQCPWKTTLSSGDQRSSPVTGDRNPASNIYRLLWNAYFCNSLPFLVLRRWDHIYRPGHIIALLPAARTEWTQVERPAHINVQLQPLTLGNPCECCY